MKVSSAISIKNVILALLSVLCVFLLAYSLGVFDLDSSGYFESYKRAAALRSGKVNKAKSWKIVISAPDYSPLGREGLNGARHAAAAINEGGGVLGKPIELLEVPTFRDFMENKLQLQKACEDNETALFFGPWLTEELPASRAIAQFQALPMVSITLAENLPALHPDLFVSLLVPLKSLTAPLVERLVAQDARRILILSRERGYYAGKFSTQLEQDMDATGVFLEVFRSEFMSPATSASLHKILKFYSGNFNMDAIIFAGDDSELAVLGQVMKSLDLSMPVFGTDLLDIPDMREKLANEEFPADLFYVSLSGQLLEGVGGAEKITGGGTADLWNQYGALGIVLFKEAVEKLGSYSPDSLSAEMWQLLAAARQKEPSPLTVRLMHIPRATEPDGF